MPEDTPITAQPDVSPGDAKPDPTPEVAPRAGWSVRIVRIARALAIVALVLASYYLGMRCNAGRSVSDHASEVVGTDVAYWTCSMHPQIQLPDPGPCPICGMDLVPVKKDIEATAPGKKERKPKYACSMMCVPPLDLPGKCPICGMDMVAVEEEGDDDEGFDSLRAANVRGEIRLSDRARQLAMLEVAVAVRQRVSVELRMVGKVDFDETRVRTISARVPGRLDRLFVDYTGITVRQGDHLASLYSPDLIAGQAELLQALRIHQAPSTTSSPEIRRMREESLHAARQKLLLWGVTPEQVNAIEERGTMTDHLTIHAPIGGIVTDKRLSEGAYVEEGTVIYTIADLTDVWVMLDAYELDLPWLRYGQDVAFTTEAYGGESFHGTIAFIAPVIDQSSRTARVRVNVSNQELKLKPGMFVRAVVQSAITADGRVRRPELAGQWICPMHPEVVSQHAGDCTKCGMPLVTAESLGYASEDAGESALPLVIPATAPLMTGRRAIVYVAQAERPGRYEGREVVLGPRAGDWYPVLEGLSEGEQVVVRGALYVDSAVQILGRQSMMHPEADTPAMSPVHQHDPMPHESDAHPETAAPDEEPEDLPTISLTAAQRSKFDPLFTNYLALQHVLAHDQFERSADATKGFIQALAEFDPTSLPPNVQDEARALHADLKKKGEAVLAASDVEAARTAFEPLSKAMIAAARRWGVGTRERLLVYHCPMAFNDRGASWLQDREGVENPYFGAVMYRCGWLEATLKADQHVGHNEAEQGK